MNINFTPFQEALIFSGIDLSNQVMAGDSGLKDEAEKEYRNKIKDAYNSQKEKLKLNFSYGKFLKIIDSNIDNLWKADISPAMRHAVAEKLSELAKKRITLKENNFDGIHRFFHKVGQLFSGHGFRTKGEWGLVVADKLDKMDLKILEKCIYVEAGGKLDGKLPKDVLNEQQAAINQLTESEFKDLLNSIIFKKTETLRVGEKHKFIFYKNLDDSKKKIFDAELLLRNDWFPQILDMIEGIKSSESVEVYKAFISDEMVLQLQSDPEKIIQMYKSKNRDRKNIWFESFFKIMIAKAVKSYLKTDSYLNIVTLKALLDKYELRLDPKGGFNILTPEEIKKLNDNVQMESL